MKRLTLTLLTILLTAYLSGCGGATNSSTQLYKSACPSDYKPLSLETKESQKELSLSAAEESLQAAPSGVYSLAQIDIHYSQSENSNQKPVHIHMKKVLRKPPQPNKDFLWVTASACGLGVDYALIKSLDANINGLIHMKMDNGNFKVLSVKNFQLTFKPSPNGEQLSFNVSDIKSNEFNSPKELYPENMGSVFHQTLDKNGKPTNEYEVTALYQNEKTKLFIRSKFRLCIPPKETINDYKKELEAFQRCTKSYNFK